MKKTNQIVVNIRLISGFILLFYVATHLLNHSVGILSLEAMEQSRLIFLGFWRNSFFSWLFPLSIIIHFSFVLQKLFLKKTLKGSSPGEWLQLILGLLIPPMLFLHYYVTRIGSSLFQTEDTYTVFLLRNFPYSLPFLFTLILIAWAHGNLGLHFYLRQKPWYSKVRQWIQMFVIILPIMAAWGVISAGRGVNAVKEHRPAEWTEEILRKANPQNMDISLETLTFLQNSFLLYYVLFLFAFFFLRFLFIWRQERKKPIQVAYLNGPIVPIHQGMTLLEASMIGDISHVHICGGRGRCSTCRSQILSGAENLSPPSPSEKKILSRVGAAPNVRLACQTIPDGNCTIHPLLPLHATVKEGFKKNASNQGSDQEIAILFADIRGFTSFSEHRLPYDVVFVLNQYFQSMGKAIESVGGHLDKFIGDGIMALFGINDTVQQGCQSAVEAAKEMSFQLEKLNERLQSELDTPLRIGIGIHCGHVIVGEMGYGKATTLTAIGDAVNTASRLESATKEYSCELIVSSEVIEKAGMDFSSFEIHDIEVRGRSQPLNIYAVKNAKQCII